MARTTKQPHGGAVNTFEKGDPGGPGRPPRLLSTIVAELKAKGYQRATAWHGRGGVRDAYERAGEELTEMVKDKTQPMSLRIVGKAMLTAKGWDVLQSMMDRVHGKPKATHEHTGKDGAPLVPPPINVIRQP